MAEGGAQGEGALDVGRTGLQSHPHRPAVTSSMTSNLSGPQCAHLKNGDNVCNKLSRVPSTE